MDLQPLPTEQTLSPFDIMSCEIKRSQFSSRSFQNNGSSIAIPVYGFNSFEQEESDGIDNVASYNDLNELSKDCTLSSSTLPPYDTMDSLYTDNTMDPSDDYNPSDGIHLFQSYFPVDESESFLLRDDSTSNLSFPCFQQGLSDTPDANCDISGAESSVDSTIIRTRNDSIDSNGIVSDALLSDINPIGIHDLQLISSSFSHCVLLLSSFLLVRSIQGRATLLFLSSRKNYHRKLSGTPRLSRYSFFARSRSSSVGAVLNFPYRSRMTILSSFFSNPCLISFSQLSSSTK